MRSLTTKHSLLAMTAMALVLSHQTPAIGAEDTVYQVDSLGRIQYHKPSYAIQDNGLIVEKDSMGRKQYHKQQYQIVGDKIQPVDSLGRPQYHKAAPVIKR